MNKDGINYSTESPGGSSQEIDHLRLQSCAASGKGRKLHSYGISTKLEAIAYAENNSKEAAARKFRVDARRIWEWWQKNAELETAAQANQRKRLHGGGRKRLSTGLEERVLQWIHDMKARGQRVSRRASKKREIIWRELKTSNETEVPAGSEGNEAEEISQQDFKASNGCVVRFMNRHGLTLRKRTSLAQHDRGNFINRVISFILNVRRKFHTKEYAMSNIIAMDETPIWLNMPSSATVNEAGASSVTIRSTRHRKHRVTVCLAAKANGQKLKPFIDFKGGKRDMKRMNEDRHLSGKCVIRSSTNGLMNESLTVGWVQYVVGRFSFAPRFLVLDTYKCHMTNEVKEALRQAGVDTSFVPGGCTIYIQAPDVMEQAIQGSVSDSV